MTTIVRFTRGWYPIREAYHSDNSSGIDRSGEYVPLAEYQALQAQYRELADSSNNAIQSLVRQRSKLQSLIQRVNEVADDLSDEMEANDELKMHVTVRSDKLEQLLNDCREVL